MSLDSLRAQQNHPIPRSFAINKGTSSANYVVACGFGYTLSVPFTTRILSLPDPNYTLNAPIPVTVDYEEDYYLVSDSLFWRYGVGFTVSEAKANYGRALLEYYKELDELEDCLAPHLALDLQALRQIIVASE
jgi:hypothetical protein